MGNFVIEIEAIGGHGCQRELKDGEIVKDCGQPRCPDCMTRRFVADLAQSNSMIHARLTHWPFQDGSVFDNLLTGKRRGSF